MKYSILELDRIESILLRKREQANVEYLEHEKQVAKEVEEMRLGSMEAMRSEFKIRITSPEGEEKSNRLDQLDAAINKIWAHWDSAVDEFVNQKIEIG